MIMFIGVSLYVGYRVHHKQADVLPSKNLEVTNLQAKNTVNKLIF